MRGSKEAQSIWRQVKATVKVEGTGTHLINPKAQPGFISKRSVPGRHTGLPPSHIY